MKNTASILFWTCVAITLAIYLVMLLWTLPEIAAQAGGLAVFDLRPTGYTYQDAVEFLSVLSPQGNEFYRTVQHKLDTAFPVFLAISTSWAILKLSSMSLIKFLAVIPIIAMGFDFLENYYVGKMLSVNLDSLSQGLVARASLFSQLKAGFSTVGYMLLFGLIGISMFRKFKNRQG